MSIQQICTFFLNGIYCGIEIEEIQEIVRQQSLTRIPLAPPDIRGLMNLRGQVMPVVDLPYRLGLRSILSNDEEEITYNIVVNTAEDVVSFIVDAIGDIVECSIDKFEPPPATLTGHVRSFIKSAYKLDRGFLLILNSQKILDATLAVLPSN